MRKKRPDFEGKVSHHLELGMSPCDRIVIGASDSLVEFHSPIKQNVHDNTPFFNGF